MSLYDDLPEWNYNLELYMRQRYAATTRRDYMNRLAKFFNSCQEPDEFMYSANGQGEFNARRSALKAFYNFCLRDPVQMDEWFGEGFEFPKSLQFDSRPPLYLDARQMRELLDRMWLHGAREHVILVLAYCAGLRACEIIKINCGDVNNQGELIYLEIFQSKYGHSRQVPLDAYASKFVSRWLEGRIELGASSDWPFLAGHQSPRKRLATWTTFTDALRACLTEMGLPMPHSPLHNWRHMGATHLAERKMPSRALQMWLGHRNLGTTQKYIDFGLKHLQDGVRDASPMAEVEAERASPAAGRSLGG